MQKIIKVGLFECGICQKNMTSENYPISLSCGNTICLNCFNNMLNSHSPCPNTKNHSHLTEPPVKNMALIALIEKVSENEPNLEKQKDTNNKENPFLKILKPIKDSKVESDKYIYSGELKDNKPFGKGELIYKDIGIFKGEFSGQYHKGKGEIFYDDGSSYKGEWENFKRQNFGTLELANLDRYEGEFKDDLYEGRGKLYLTERNLVYEGFWRDGKKFGEFNIYNDDEEFIKKEKYDNNIKL